MAKSIFLGGLALVLLVAASLVLAADLHDANVLKEELDDIGTLIETLTQRKKTIQRALDMQVDGLESFHAAFVPLAIVDPNPKYTLAGADVIRVLRKDKKSSVYFSVGATTDARILVFDASGGEPIATVPLKNEPCNVDESNSCVEPAIKDESPVKEIRAGSGGSRPFVATLHQSGIVRVHGMAFKRGTTLDKASFWNGETVWSNETVNQTQVAVRKDVFVHTNGTATSMIIHSTVQRSQLILGTDNGQVYIIDPAAPKAAQSVNVQSRVAVMHLAISNTLLMVGLANGSIRFITLGNNKVLPEAICSVPPGMGSISSLAFLETKSAFADRARFFFVATSSKDLIMYDRKSQDNPTAQQKKKRGNFLSTIISSPTGKVCLPVRRLPNFTFGRLAALPAAQLLVMTSRGPEVVNASSLFASYGMMPNTDRLFLHRTDFVAGSSLSDFAVVLLNENGKGATAYSFLAAAAAYGEGSIMFVADTGPSENWLQEIRVPFVMILALCGMVLMFNRRYGRATATPHESIRRKGGRFGGATRGGTRGGGRSVTILGGDDSAFGYSAADFGGGDDGN